MTDEFNVINETDKKVDELFTTIRLVIAGIFIYSGFSKLTRPSEYFEIVVNQYQIFPSFFSHYISCVLPWVEYVLGGYLLLGFKTRFTAALLTSLSIIFQIVLAQALLRNLPIDKCGCFGGDFVNLSLYQSFFLDTVMVIGLSRLTLHPQLRLSLDNYLNFRIS